MAKCHKSLVLRAQSNSAANLSFMFYFGHLIVVCVGVYLSKCMCV